MKLEKHAEEVQVVLFVLLYNNDMMRYFLIFS